MNLFKISTACMMIMVVIGFLYIENTCIQSTVIEIYSDKIPEAFNDYVIVQVSDLHNTQFGDHQSKLINRIEQATPDLIVVTGDLIYKRSQDMKYSLEFINEAVRIAPVYFVVGNHESQIPKSYFQKLRQSLLDQGVFILENQGVKLSIGDEQIHLFGVNDSEMYEDENKDNAEIMDDILSEMEIDCSQFNILLSHRPELIEVYERHGYDLVFAGHAHGGQIRIPFLGAIWAPGQGLFPKYTSGLCQYNNMQMIVSRGLGKSAAPFRIFNRPEIVVCKLKRGSMNR